MRLCKREHPAGTKVREVGGAGPPVLLRVGGAIANYRLSPGEREG